MYTHHNITLNNTERRQNGGKTKNPSREFAAFKEAGSCSDPLIGRLVDGKYSILEKLGQGGTAAVYAAIDNESEKTVAFKIALDDGNLQKMNSFIDNEALKLAAIPHPRIVRPVEAGEFQGRKYLVMEFLEGKSLDQKMQEGDGLSWETSRQVIVKVCEALSEVHGKGLVHRDVKPANVFITLEGDVKLLDFGLATEAGSNGEAGLVLGTPSYLAPESVFENTCDQRMDIYALGVMAYEMLCGAKPFTATSVMEILYMHRDLMAEWPSEIAPWLAIPKAIETLIMKALEKDPKKRISSADEMKMALEALPCWNTTIKFDYQGLGLGITDQAPTRVERIKRLETRLPTFV